MRKILITGALALPMMGLFSCRVEEGGAKKGNAGGPPRLQSQLDSVSYIIGMDIGKSFKQQSLELVLDQVQKGIEDVLAGRDSVLTDSVVQATMTAFQTRMMAKQDSLRKVQTEEGLKAGEAFLAKNAKEEGVKTTASGLQYKVIEEGKGKIPTASDTVVVHYRGTLLDGTEFDSSYKRGEPVTFPVSGVIPGWTEALQLMKEGAKWKLVIPAGLAYGERGAGAQIPPNSTLIFEVELITVKKS